MAEVVCAPALYERIKGERSRGTSMTMSSSKTSGSPPAIAQRKADHLEIAASGRADFEQRTTLLEHVHLVHDALPEFALDDVDLAPDVVLLGNIGGVQALTMGAERVAELARRLGADAMAIHLNPGQELIQAHGDRDFSGVLDNIARMVDALRMPLVVKETGCGLSPRVIAK